MREEITTRQVILKKADKVLPKPVVTITEQLSDEGLLLSRTTESGKLSDMTETFSYDGEGQLVLKEDDFGGLTQYLYESDGEGGSIETEITNNSYGIQTTTTHISKDNTRIHQTVDILMEDSPTSIRVEESYAEFEVIDSGALVCIYHKETNHSIEDGTTLSFEDHISYHRDRDKDVCITERTFGSGEKKTISNTSWEENGRDFFFIEEEDGVVTKKGRKTLDKECNWESSHEEEYGHFEEDGVLYHVRITDEHYDYPENGRFD